MDTQEIDITSLITRIEQLEEDLNVRKKNITWLKRYFDELRQEFNNRPEVEQIGILQSAIAHLTTQISELQQRLVPLDESASIETVETDDLVTIESINSDTVVTDSINTDIVESNQDQEVIAVEPQQLKVSAFTEEEFKAERILFLIDRFYALEEERKNQAISAEEFSNLLQTNLTAANLTKANLKKVQAYNTNFNGAILSEVNLVGVSLSQNMSGVILRNANLCGADVRNKDLSGADLSSADLRGADLQQAKLEKANLKDANISGANLNGANLSGAIMPDGTTYQEDK